MNEWQAIPKSYKSAWLVLLAGLLATGYAGHAVKSEIDSDVRRQFASDCQEARLRIEARLQAHKLVLLGGAALFDASDKVNRDDWRTYAHRVEIDQHFNGIQGLGFSLLIPKDQLTRHIAEIRSQGFPDYTVRPPGARAPYSSIIYLEPFKDRNLRAFGYDMYAEPVRRAAMEQARDGNVAALSGKVELVQETEQDVQAGTLMYVPVYQKRMPLETVAQRRAALRGWVYSPFRMSDLLQGTLKGWDNPRIRHLRLQVYDGGTVDAEHLLYSSDAEQGAAASPALFTLEQRTEFNGREWTLHFEQVRGSVSGMDYSNAWLTMIGGTGLSILSFLLVLSFLNTRRNAVRIAGELTAELREASGYARSLIEASLDPLVTISAAGKITDVNHATTEITGMTRTELIGTDFSDYFTEPERAREGYQQVFRDGYVTDYPLALRHRDGQVTDVLYNASIYRNAAGAVSGVFAAARDVTERKQAEEELRKLNNDFVTLLENTSDFIYFKDQDSRIRFCSQTLADITGHKSWHDMIGKHDLEIFPADTARIYYEEELPIFREGKALLNKIDPYYNEQGKQGWVSTNKWPVFGDDKKTVIGIFGISRDITELKEAENRINELNRGLERRVAARTAELEAANKELEAFSYSVSHDLRTPLRAIDGFSLMLLEDYDGKLDDEGRRLLRVVRDNTSRMSRLIDDILRFSRAGRTGISFSDIDMEEVVRGVIEELKPLTAGRKLQINLGRLPAARGDRAMLHQVFVNLLANAIKFTGKNETARIDIGGRTEAGHAVYYVKDNGAGFDMQYADKLFGVFQRLHGVDEFEGTGIGLAIVKRIVTRHGGKVWAEGEVGKGATFYFSIPADPGENA